ncbi:MAG: hypothetical protein ABL899_00795 [Nitrospira sp.]
MLELESIYLIGSGLLREAEDRLKEFEEDMAEEAMYRIVGALKMVPQLIPFVVGSTNVKPYYEREVLEGLRSFSLRWKATEEKRMAFREACRASDNAWETMHYRKISGSLLYHSSWSDVEDEAARSHFDKANALIEEVRKDLMPTV